MDQEERIEQQQRSNSGIKKKKKLISKDYSDAHRKYSGKEAEAIPIGACILVPANISQNELPAPTLNLNIQVETNQYHNKLKMV